MITVPDGAVRVTDEFSAAVPQIVPEFTRDKLTALQLSLLPLSTCDGIIEAVPEALSQTLIFLHKATGFTSSTTVISNITVCALHGLVVAETVTCVIPLLNVCPLPVPDPEPVVAPVNAYVIVGEGEPEADNG